MTRSQTLPSLPVASVATAAVLSAALVGVGLAASVALGLGVLIALCYAPLVFLNLPLALALWVPLIFFQAVPALNLGGEAAGLVIAFGWLGTLRSQETTEVLVRHRRLLGVLALLIVWLTLSLLWADDLELAREDLWQWYAIALLFAIVMTTMTSARAIQVFVGLFVVGLFASVAIDFVSTDVVTSTGADARLEGSAGDPNFLAAMIVVAVVLGLGLAAATRNAPLRLALVAAVIFLSVAFVSTGSRGGFVAALLTAVAALVVFRGRRVYVVAVLLVVVGIGVPLLAASPDTWDRLTHYDDGGSGRVDLWTAGWRMAQDHPVAGVGFNNFRAVSSDYTREPGALERVEFIVDRPHVVHNTYLQLLAENGVIGLLLFVAFVVGCTRAALLAAKRFEERGDRSMGTLARAVLVACVAMLGAALFLSAAVDQRLWVLLALGPGLLAAAHRSPAATASPTSSVRAAPSGLRSGFRS
ncbi:MAG: O-antigen ligase family protein [Thermoleophilaceae bacterium]